MLKMITGNLSKEEIKRQIEDIRLNRKLSEFERTKAIRKQYAEELSVIHDALDSSVSGVIISNLDGKIIYVNNTFLRIFDYQTKTEVLGKNAADLFVEESIKKLADVKATIDRAEGEVDEFAVRRKDGNIFPVEVSTSKVSDNSGKIVGRMASFFDISKRKRAEEEKEKLRVRLLEALKMESIATLAGGVAHEINNALQGIIGNIDLLRTYYEHDKSTRERITQMDTYTSRMGQLIRQLLAFAREGQYQSKSLSVNTVVEDVLTLIQHAIDPAIRIETHLDGNIKEIAADPVQMKMVVSAVVMNAAEAIHGSGIVRVYTQMQTIAENLATYPNSPVPGHYVCLTVEDTGTGMDEKTKERIFDPFFTTKFQGRGLGMAAAYGIVEKHGGGISVESDVGKGTIVRIYLPASQIHG
jgi:two-component system cell cycle sensor histidine kinase/response regulator CckA